MSKLKEVLGVLGLEVGKEFHLFKNGEKIPGRYHFADTGNMVARSIVDPNIYQESRYSLNDLITREDLIIEPVPFIPKCGEQYWRFGVTGNIGYTIFNNDTLGLFMLATGFCFRTEQEAIDNKGKYEEMMEAIRNGARLVLKRGYEQ